MVFTNSLGCILHFACHVSNCGTDWRTLDRVSVLCEIKPVCLRQRIGDCTFPPRWCSRVSPLAQRASVSRCDCGCDDHSVPGRRYSRFYWISGRRIDSRCHGSHCRRGLRPRTAFDTGSVDRNDRLSHPSGSVALEGAGTYRRRLFWSCRPTSIFLDWRQMNMRSKTLVLLPASL